MARTKTRVAVPKSPAATPAGGHFTGFPPGGDSFFRELARKQDREWFAANKHRYEAQWIAPLEALLSTVIRGLAKTYPEIARGRPKVFRLHRDLRFAKDKAPYKTHASAIVPLGPGTGEEMGSGLYLHFAPDEKFVALGRWMIDGTGLQRFRNAVGDDGTGKKLSALVNAAHKRGFKTMAHEALKRVPAPYPQDHPRAELLKLRGLALSFPPIPKGLIAKPEFAKWVVDQARVIAPLIRQVESIVTGGTE